MNDKKIRKLVLAALLAALVCVATMVVQIPSPMQGYVNLGDCFVLLSGWLLGPWYGFAAGGIGSMLADIFLGYAHYAPGTLVIKGVMALVAALMYEKMGRTATSRIAGGVVVVLLTLRAVFIGVAELVEALSHVFALRRFQTKRKTADLTIAPAERDARFGEVELQFSKFVCCHTLHLVCG